MSCDITVIILTKNEEKHIERCINSVRNIAKQIFVLDSFSDDDTIRVARQVGAFIYQRHFINHSDQWRWAIRNYGGVCGSRTKWVMKLDADEYVTPKLANLIQESLKEPNEGVAGWTVMRLIKFLGKSIRYGGCYQRSLRIWRDGMGDVEQRWMDEHVIVRGGSVRHLKGDIVDESRNSLSWWIAKHNAYASKEACELLIKKLDKGKQMEHTTAYLDKKARMRRLLKERIYESSPKFLRAISYFGYRVFFRFGFMDGGVGLAYHFLQGFWYRFLVDLKMLEVESCVIRDGMRLEDAIKEKLGVDPSHASS